MYMRVYMYIYVYIYIYTHMCVFSYMYTHVYVYVLSGWKHRVSEEGHHVQGPGRTENGGR